MGNWCWNIRKIKKTGQGLSEELGKYIWLAKAGTSQEAPASKSGSSSLTIYYKEGNKEKIYELKNKMLGKKEMNQISDEMMLKNVRRQKTK